MAPRLQPSDNSYSQADLSKEGCNNAKPPQKQPELSSTDKSILTFGIPALTAVVGSPAYTVAKQFQNNVQLGTKLSPWKLHGLGPTTLQMIARIGLRTGPVPIIKEFAEKNAPEEMDKKTVRNLATFSSLFIADLINIPPELIATKQQSWKAESGKPKPTFGSFWQESKSAFDFIGKLYGLDRHLKGSPIIGVGLRTAPFLGSLVWSKSYLTEQAPPKNLTDKIIIDLKATFVGTLVNSICIPFSALGQQTMRFDNPRTFVEAGAEIAGKGMKGLAAMYKSSFFPRMGVTGAGAAMTLASLTGQELYTEYVKNQRTAGTGRGAF